MRLGPRCSVNTGPKRFANLVKDLGISYAETRLSLLPYSQNCCRLILHTHSVCSSHANQISVASASYPSRGLQYSHPKTLLLGAGNPDCELRGSLVSLSHCPGGERGHHNLQFGSRSSLNDRFQLVKT